MRILAIDTSTQAGSVAVLDGDVLLFEISYQTKASHSEVLIKEIEAALKKAKLKIEDIDAFAVAIGPGSFTGLRIGLATAKGLALAQNKPIVGVSTLEALSFVIPLLCKEGEGEVEPLPPLTPPYKGGENVIRVPCINAYRGEVYTTINNEECSITPEALCDRLRDIKGELLFVGDGAIQYKDIFAQRLGNRFVLSKEKVFPPARAVGLIAFKRLQKNERDELAKLIPNYIRKSDAETKALKPS